MNEHVETPTVTISSKSKKKGGFTGFLMVVVLTLLAGLVATGFLYFRTRQELVRLTQPNAQEELAKREIQAVVQKLGKLAILPEEEPVVATIIDSAFLATQSAFYQKAEDGDKLVVYPQAQKAFIYSPGRNVIVNAGPLVLDPNEQTPTGTEPAADQPEASVKPTPKASPSPEASPAEGI